jgi:hypothetical protein
MTQTIDPRFREDVFRGSSAVAAGATSWHQLRSAQFARLVRDVYLPSSVAVTHFLRCRAASLIIPDGAAITGRSAATVLGVPLASPWSSVEVVVSEEHRFGPVRGLRVRRVVAGKVEHVEHDGVPVVAPARMALDLGMRTNLVEAVADLDQVLRAGLVDEDDLTRFLAKSHERGVRRARRAFSFSDPRARSREETRLRLLLVLAGLWPVPQYQVCDAFGFVARAGLAFPLQKVTVEYDPAQHADAEQATCDRMRRNALRAAGWRVMLLRAAQLHDEPQAVVAAVRAVLASG